MSCSLVHPLGLTSGGLAGLATPPYVASVLKLTCANAGVPGAVQRRSPAESHGIPDPQSLQACVAFVESSGTSARRQG